MLCIAKIKMFISQEKKDKKKAEFLLLFLIFLKMKKIFFLPALVAHHKILRKSSF